MPKGFGRPFTKPERNTPRLNEGTGSQENQKFARDMNRKIRDSNVDIAKTKQKTREVMAGAGPYQKPRKGFANTPGTRDYAKGGKVK